MSTLGKLYGLRSGASESAPREFMRKSPFVIAEVGQNHQGDVDLAREYVKTFSRLGADAIKFQMRDISSLFDESAVQRPYLGPQSFGGTYGEHRQALELGVEELMMLRTQCSEEGVLFGATPFDETSLNRLVSLRPDFIKIASFDAGNLPFISLAAATGIPLVMSTGGARPEQVRQSVTHATSYGQEVAVLHCVSMYPCPPERLALGQIASLTRQFPDTAIGLSDHFSGILSGPVAYVLGARVFEKHVTLNRSWKGTDHSFSLEPAGFGKYVRDLRRIESMMTPLVESELGTEPVFGRLGKSLVAARDIEAQSQVRISDLTGRIFADTYIPVRQSNEIIDRRARCFIPKGSILRIQDFE